MDDNLAFLLETPEDAPAEEAQAPKADAPAESTQDEQTTAVAEPTEEQAQSEGEPSTTEPAADESGAPQESEADASEKRRKDAERAYQTEHQARLEVEKQLEEFRAIQRQQAAGIADEEIKRRMEDDPIAFVIEQNRQIKELQDSTEAKIQKAISDDRWESQESAFQEANPDYYDLVTPLKAQFHEGALTQKWIDAGGTPEAAYNIAKTERDVQQMRDNPEAFKESIIAEIMAKTQNADTSEGAKAKAPATLANVNSSPPAQIPEPEGDELFGTDGRLKF